MKKVLFHIALLFIVAVSLTCLLSCQRGRQKTAEQKNILLITLDTLRADHLKSYGYAVENAPNISSFASKAGLYTKAISQSAWTLPSHASILTGLYPHRHFAEQWQTAINRDAPMLSEILQDEGYDTAAFVSTVYVSALYGFSRGFSTFDQMGSFNESLTFAKTLTDKGVKWLEKSKSPFFLWLHYYDIHHKFIYHKDSGFPYVEGLEEKELKYSRWNDANPEFAEYVKKNRKEFISLYDGEIYYTDFNVGRILRHLEEANLLENTIVVITSDHGESFGNHNMVGHDLFLYNDLVHVPLILYVPGKKPYVDNQFTELRDIMPTILELLNIPKPDQVKTRSLFSDRTYACAENHNRNRNRTVAIYKDNWKLIYTLNQRKLELYDMAADPRELSNIADSQKEVVKNLKSILFKELGIVDVSEEMLKELRALGYIE